MSLSAIPRLPNRPSRPYIRPVPKKVKAMTIVIGFQCGDGIVLAADRLLSAEGHHKFQESKLIPIGTLHCTFYMAYSGLPVLAKEAAEKLGNRLCDLDDDITGREILSRQDAKKCIEDTLVEMSQQRYDKLTLSLLIVATYPKGVPDLFIFNETGFHTVNEFEVLGVGDSSLIRYLQQLYNPIDNTSTCERLAIFLIEKAKEHIDGCGGKTDLLSVRQKSNGQWETIQMPEAQIAQIAKQMNEKESIILKQIIGD